VKRVRGPGGRFLAAAEKEAAARGTPFDVGLEDAFHDSAIS